MPPPNITLIQQLSKNEAILASTKGGMQVFAAAVLQEQQGSVVGTVSGQRKRHKLAKDVIESSFNQLPVLETAAAEIMRVQGIDWFSYTQDANDIANFISQHNVSDNQGNQINFWSYLSGVTRAEF